MVYHDGPFLLKLLVTVKIMYRKKVFQMCNKCCQGCSGEHYQCIHEAAKHELKY